VVISGIGGTPANSMPSRVGETTSPLVHRHFAEKLDGLGRGATGCLKKVSNKIRGFPQ
jgi:hypothetical protein